MTELTTAIEKATATGERKTVAELVERNAVELARKLPKGMELAYFQGALLSEMRRSPTLYECDPASVVSAFTFSLQLGLTPGPLGHVYLVPFKSACTFILGYRGMVELAYRSGKVKDVSAGLVHDGDAFDLRRGTRPYLDHVPAGPAGERELTAAYAVARLASGGTVFEAIYPEDWERSRKRSAAGSKGTGPWATDYTSMVKKTAVRRLSPFLPQSPQLADAIAWDDSPAPAFDEVEPLPPEATDGDD